MNGLRDAPYGDPFLAKAVECLGTNDEQDFYIVHGQLDNLFEKLAKRVRDLSQKFEAGKNNDETTAFPGCKELFQKLAQEFDLGIYNLNYDTVALNAVPDPFFTGFNPNGDFQPREIHSREGWSFIYHLHGSVHYSINGAPDGRIVWIENLKSAFKDTNGILVKGADGRVRILSTIVAGGGKLDQLQAEPFQTFYSSLPRHAYEADAVLIGGYSFGDNHVNSILTNALLNRTERVPILLLEKSDCTSSTKSHVVSALWKRQNAQNTLRLMNLNKPGPCSAGAGSGFEYLDDVRRPTAMWLNGFETASAKSAAILQWLRSGSFEHRTPHQ